MLQIFTTIEEYLLTTRVSVRDSMRALNAATDRLQSQRLTIPESIAFGNLTALIYPDINPDHKEFLIHQKKDYVYFSLQELVQI